MNYTAENIDVKAFEDALRDYRRIKLQEKLTAIKEAEAYFRGYDDAIEQVTGMLHCSNYEKRDS